MFIDRENELSHLKEEYARSGPRFVVIYGRRRTGKTALVEEFMKEKADVIYYMADQQVEQQQIEDFKKQVLEYRRDEFLERTRFADWDHFFAYLVKMLPSDKRVLLVIDEVTYVIKNRPAFSSVLQKYWDRHLSKSGVFLVLSGSLVGLMLKKVLGYNAPLYGRRTSQIHLKPFDFSVSSLFMKEKSVEERIRTYALTGGVAKYLLLAAEEKSAADLIKNKFLEKEGFFYQEGLFLLLQEFKNPTVYMSVLKAVSMGKNNLKEMADFTGIEGKKISMYLDVLQTIGIVAKIVPVTEDEKKFRGAFYRINDNFLKFWFRFIFPNKSRIEIRDTGSLYKEILSSLNTYIGPVFEDVGREFLSGLNKKGELPFSFAKAGTWWGAYRDDANERKIAEIDVVAVNEETAEILFCECRWRDLSQKDAEKLVAAVKEKATHVGWNAGKRKEYFAVFARKIEGKGALRKSGILAWDLDDYEK